MERGKKGEKEMGKQVRKSGRGKKRVGKNGSKWKKT